MNLERTVTKCRQWLFPREFRIHADGREDWTDLLVELLSGGAPVLPAEMPLTKEADNRAGAGKAPTESDGAAVSDSAAPSGIDADFAMKLCNSLHRLKRNIARLERSGNSPQEVQNMNRVLERADPLLESYGIRYADLAGQTYHDGRNDFDPIGRPEEVPGLTGKKISLCEYPVVYLNEALVQRARGTVAVPPGNTE